MTEPSTNALREAEQYTVAAQTFDGRGNDSEAARMEDQAMEAYIEAGLDPAWHDDEAMLEAWGERCPNPTKTLMVVDQIDEMLVLSDDATATVDGTNIRINEAAVDDIEE
jgi:hypothetical protein